MKVASRSVLALALFPLAASCSGTDISDEPFDPICHPYGGQSCLLPWPSSAFLRADDTTATGLRLDLPADAMPMNEDGIVVDPEPFSRFDGFSPSGALFATFAGGVSGEGLPGPGDLAASLSADAPIVLVNLDTGERAPFFAEVDRNVESPDEAALLIRPVVRLDAGARYGVAVTTAVKAADGGPLIVPTGYETLAAGGSLPGERGERVTAGFDSLMAGLADAGVAAEDVAFAWDFVTASDESLTADLRAMRDAALPAMGELGSELSFQAEVVEENGTHTLRRLIGTYQVPSFLSDGERESTLILRDESGTPELGGTLDANFAAIVPACLAEATEPVPVIVFGHGLFGTAEEYMRNELLQEAANDYCMVMIAGDWIGLSERQIPLAARAANDLNHAQNLTDMLGQSVVNFIALEQIVRGPLRDSEHFQAGDGPILDPERVYYMGASLGGIMGGTFMAYDPFIERGVLGVPGGSWSMLIERSAAWRLLQAPAQASYRTPGEYQLLIAFLAWELERWDPITTAPRVLADPLPGTPAKQLFLYEGRNDAVVTNLATEMLARTLGVPITGPTVYEPFGFEVTPDPVPSAFTIYDENVMPPGDTNEPPEDDNGTHSGVNERAAVLRQIEGFFVDGVVRHECALEGEPAPCDCSTGACD